MKPVDFFFDLSSPYSYLAATQMDALAKRRGAQVTWKPMVLGAVFKAAGNVMPAACPPKAQYMLRDLDRWARRYEVPFQMTTRFPVNAMQAMRLTVAAEAEGKSAKAALAAFRALWVEDRDITAEPEAPEDRGRGGARHRSRARGDHDTGGQGSAARLHRRRDPARRVRSAGDLRRGRAVLGKRSTRVRRGRARLIDAAHGRKVNGGGK